MDNARIKEMKEITKQIDNKDSSINEALLDKYSTDMKMLSNLAQNGDPSAQRAIEKIVGIPEGTIAKNYKSFEANKQRAENGDVWAMGKLGQTYLLGYGVEKNLEQAEYWLKKAADEDDVAGLYFLGTLYSFKGEFANASYKKAKYYIGLAIEAESFGKGSIGAVSLEQAKEDFERVSRLAISEKD